MAAFNLAEAIGLKKASNLDTGEITEIGLDLIDPNPKNFFQVEDDLTDLCESIKVNGLLQPPVVMPSENGRYRLIAGHRRHKALMTLWSEDPERYKTVTCRIVRPSSPELEELMLIQTNTEAREIGYRERNEAVKRVEAILVEMQKNGVKLPGKMRSHVAKIIKSSESQIARASFIDKNLIEPLKRGSGISDSAAYKLAHLPAEQQQELHDHYQKTLYMLDCYRIKNYLDNIAAGRKPFYVEPPGPRTCYEKKAKNGQATKCDHGEIIKKHNKKKLPTHQKCSHTDCCSYCGHRFDCEDVCAAVKKIVDKHKKTDTYRCCNALRLARERKGLTVEEVSKVLNVSISQMQTYETNQTHTIGSLQKLCKLYDVTPNEILGFENVNSTLTSLEWVPADRTDDLPDGLYFMLYEYSKPYICDSGEPLVQERAVLRRDGSWHLLPSLKKWSAISGEKLVAVLPAPPIPAGWSLTFEPFGIETEEAEEDCN